MGDPGRARHRLPRPGGPSPVAGRARPGAGALTRRIRALPDGAMSTLTWDQGSEMARHQRQGRRHRDRRVLRPPPQPLGKGHEREHQPPRAPLPAQRHPHHQPPTPARAPSPTNRATAPAPPSTTSPHKKHSPNSLSPPLDTAPLSGHYFTGEASQYRYIQSACFRLFTASERL